MAYDIDTDKFTWIYLTAALSTSQFVSVYHLLYFPFYPSANLIEICRNFGVTYAYLMQNPDSHKAVNRLKQNLIEPSFDLFEGKVDSPFQDKKFIMYRNMFLQFEQLGYAQEIYDWGNETSSNFRERNPIKYKWLTGVDRFLFLLRNWIVANDDFESQFNEYGTYKAVLNTLIAKQRKTYEQRGLPRRIIQSPRLSQQSLLSLGVISLNNHLQKFHLEGVIEGFSHLPKTIWEDYALRSCAASLWIKAEGNHRNSMKTHQRILDTFSLDELKVLEDWANNLLQNDEKIRLQQI